MKAFGIKNPIELYNILIRIEFSKINASYYRFIAWRNQIPFFLMLYLKFLYNLNQNL